MEDIWNLTWACVYLNGYGYNDYLARPAWIGEDEFGPRVKAGKENGKVFFDSSFISIIPITDDIATTPSGHGITAIIGANQVIDPDGKPGLYLMCSFDLKHPEAVQKAMPLLRDHLDDNFPIIVALMGELAQSRPEESGDLEKPSKWERTELDLFSILYGVPAPKGLRKLYSLATSPEPTSEKKPSWLQCFTRKAPQPS